LSQIPAMAKALWSGRENHVRVMRPLSPAASAQAETGTRHRLLLKLLSQNGEPILSLRVFVTALGFKASPLM
jgi:hypothetical protein